MNTERLKTPQQHIVDLTRKSYEDDFKGMNDSDTLLQITRGNSGLFIRAIQDFAQQESKRAVDEALIDKDFIIYCLNQSWNYAHEQLQKKDLGDIERDIYQKQKDKAKALMTKLDSLT